jgi:RimJ/RimL family protein N-acetyltransferase
MKTATRKAPVLRGDTVTLRPIDPGKDAPGFFAEMDDPDLWRWTDDVQPKTAAELKHQLAGWLAMPDLTSWAIVDSATGAVVGTVRVEVRSEGDRVIVSDQVNQVARSVWRRGHHREACQLVFDWAFAKLGAEEIRTKAWAPNDNAWRSMEALGFERLREAHYMNVQVGVPMPMRHYLLTKKKWMEQKKATLRR